MTDTTNSKNFLPEALYPIFTLFPNVELLSPVIGKAIRFNNKTREVVVELGLGITGVIPENEVSIYNFTFPAEHTIPYQISTIIGKKIRAIVIGKRSDGTIILSRKRSQIEAWELLEEGMIVDAIVTNINSYGIFIDIGNGLNSFVYIANCSYAHYHNLNLWFKKGYHTFVKIIEKNNESLKINVSRKDAYPTLVTNPSLVYEGDVVSVRISGETSEGYFCEITPGISGIIDTDKEFKEGETTRGFVKEITPKGLKLKCLES